MKPTPVNTAEQKCRLNSPETPDGWKLVPIELTAEMAQAARDAHEGEAYLPYSIYRAMLSVAPSPATVQGFWIACAERMPEHGKDVQVYCSDTKEQFVGFHIGKGDFQFAKDELGNKIVCNPTHWMPLPAPPAAPTELLEGE